MPRMTQGQVDQHEARLRASRQRVIASPARFDVPEVSIQRITLTIVIEGQIMGGKNNMVVTRTGKRFPKASWARWRDNAVNQVKSQLPKGFCAFDKPVNARLDYVAGDKRRRDMPAVIDAIFHVLEKAGVVTDDWHVWIVESARSYSKEHPRAVISFLAD